MNCEAVRTDLEGCRTRDELSAEARAHLQDCTACTQYATAMPQTDELLRRALTGPPADAAWRNVKAGLAAKLDAERAVLPLRARRRWVWAAAAALIMALLSGGLVSLLLARRASDPGRTIALHQRIERLQQRVRQDGVLEELQQLQNTFDAEGTTDAKAAAEDAEFYVERLMSLNANDAEQSREVLSGIRAAQIARKIRTARQQIAPDKLAPVADSLDLVVAMLDEADHIMEAQGGRDAH